MASTATHLAIGAPGISDGPTNTSRGSVHVFARRPGGGFELVQSVPGPEDSADRRFGLSLAMGADFLAVGSANYFHAETNPRAVVDIHGMNYPTPGAWGREARFEVRNRNLFSGGQIVSVATDGQTIFAGFPAMEKVLVIRRSGGTGPWQVSQTLTAPDPSLFQRFGQALAVDGNWLAVSAPFKLGTGLAKESLLLFRKESDQWRFSQKLPPDPASSGGLPGSTLSLSGDWMAAGDEVSGDISLYRHDGSGHWAFFQRLSNVEADYFSFDLKGSELLCGSVWVNTGAISSGRGELFTFRSDAWQRQAEFRTSHPVEYGLMGEGALIDEHGYFLGSGYRSVDSSYPGIPPGTCHFFERPALETYAAWAQRNFAPGQIESGQSRPEAVTNPLGVTNWLSYAMGLDPRSPDPAALPRLEFDPLGGRWEFRFQIRPHAADFSYRLLSSVNLEDWAGINGSPSVIGYAPEVQRQAQSLPVSSSVPQFIRLEVTPLAE